MSRNLTSKELEDINQKGSPYNVLAEPLRGMSEKEQRKAFLLYR